MTIVLLRILYSCAICYIMVSISSVLQQRVGGVEEQDLRDNCECFSRKLGKSFSFCYQNPGNLSLKGDKFSCGFMEYLEELDLLNSTLPSSNLSNPTKLESDEITVTAFSDDHYPNFVKSHRKFRNQYPRKKMLIYGLNTSESVLDDFKLQFPNDNFEFRAFQYWKYPSYVANWMEYRFKFLIISEVLQEYSNIWWKDAHNTIHADNYMEKVYHSISNSSYQSPIWSNVITMHSNYAVLHPGLLFYFPVTHISMLKKERQLGANNMYIARTPEMIEIMKWMTLCSLQKSCMSPPGAQPSCGFSNDFFGKWGKCFRFDQSAINLLLLNRFGSHEKFKSAVVGVGIAGRV